MNQEVCTNKDQRQMTTLSGFNPCTIYNGIFAFSLLLRLPDNSDYFTIAVNEKNKLREIVRK